jgi:hypothetical protein
MNNPSEKTTIYLSPTVRRALKRRVIDADQSMSEYVERALVQAIAEDLEDIEAIEGRIGDETETLDEFIAALEKDGLI